MAEASQAASADAERGDPELDSVFAPNGEVTGDRIATQEATSLAAGVDLEKDGKAQEHRRHQTFRNHINRATIWIFWVIALSLLIGIIIFSYHLLTPDSWHFLAEKQIEKLQTLLPSAVLSSALTGYVNRRMA
ncbi:Transmembrane protein [Ralstonia mannitolilytica]|uniref:hypothetical protein n=1 Tax=Ralstonia mannitolilytica TaxID=105219 RepID=UPI0039B4BE2D